MDTPQRQAGLHQCHVCRVLRALPCVPWLPWHRGILCPEPQLCCPVLWWQAGDTLLWPAGLVLCRSSRPPEGTAAGLGRVVRAELTVPVPPEHAALLGLLIKAMRSELGTDLSSKSLCRVFMPLQFPFLQLLCRGVLSEEPVRTFCCSGNEKQFAVLSPPAKELKTNKQTMSRCLRSEMGTHSKVDKVPFHTAVMILLIYVWVQFHHEDV